MARIGFIGQASGSDGHNPVKDSKLAVAFATFAQPFTNLEFEVLGELSLVVVEVRIKSHGSEIIAIDDYRDVALGVMEATWDGSPRGEAHVFERATVRVFPDGTRIAAAADTAKLLRHKM